MDEQIAMQTIEKAGSRSFCYQGEDPAWNGRTGTFAVAFDMNCCAPTDQVLFEFNSSGLRKVMNAQGFLEFYASCEALP